MSSLMMVREAIVLQETDLYPRSPSGSEIEWRTVQQPSPDPFKIYRWIFRST